MARNHGLGMFWGVVLGVARGSLGGPWGLLGLLGVYFDGLGVDLEGPDQILVVGGQF